MSRAREAEAGSSTARDFLVPRPSHMPEITSPTPRSSCTVRGGSLLWCWRRILRARARHQKHGVAGSKSTKSSVEGLKRSQLNDDEVFGIAGGTAASLIAGTAAACAAACKRGAGTTGRGGGGYRSASMVIASRSSNDKKCNS